MVPLVLASTSPARRALLRDAGLQAEALAPGVDEDVPAGLPVFDVASLLARRKAGAVAARRPDAWVIGADQVAFAPDSPDQGFGKPRDRADGLARLASLRGKAHCLTTGLCLRGPGFVDVAVVTSTLWMRADVTDDELAAYVRTGEGDGCAGGYAVEARGSFLFDRVEGDWNNVIGLPVFRLFDLLRARGWRFA